MAKTELDLPGLFPELALISDAELRDKVERIWQRLWEESAFERIEDVPVTPEVPYQNIKHQQAYVKAVIAVARVFEEVHGAGYDFDHLIAGSILADAGKLVEYQRVDGGYELSELGRRLPHAAYVAHLALAEGVPLPVVHIIATHSPNSGMAPSTQEAQLLHWIDQADLTGFGYDLWIRRVIHHM